VPNEPHGAYGIVADVTRFEDRHCFGCLQVAQLTVLHGGDRTRVTSPEGRDQRIRHADDGAPRPVRVAGGVSR